MVVEGHPDKQFGRVAGSIAVVAYALRQTMDIDVTLNPVTTRVRRGRMLRWVGWFAMANALVMILIALRYLEVGSLSSTPAGLSFGIAMFVAHASTMAAVLWLPAFALALIWPQRHVVVPLSLAIGIAAVVVLITDTVVYQQYRFHINTAILSLLFSRDAGAIFQFSAAMEWQIGLLVAGIVIGQWLLARLVWWWVVRTHGHRHGHALASVLVVVFVATNLYHAYADARGLISVTRQTRLLPLYEPLTAKDFLASHGVDVAATPRNQIAEVHGANLHYPRLPLVTSTPDRRPNIVFIMIDSWRFDAMSRQITPHVAAFARHNIRFMHHVSGGNGTRTGVFSLFYGIPGPYWQNALQTGTRAALIQRLDTLGYHFAVFPSAPLTSPAFSRTVFAGMTGLRLRSTGDSSPARDIDANRGFLHFLDTRNPEQPFFGWVFYDSAHAYDLPDDAPHPFQPSWDSVNYLALNADTDPVPFENLYKNAVHFVDGLIGRVLKKLRTQGLLDHTIVIITGDHGQEFNDLGQNYWGHNGDYSRYQTQVPMIVHWPGRAADRVSYLTSHYDVAATLMKRVLGVDNAFQATSVGRDLFHSGGRLPIIMAKYRGYAAYTGSRYIIFPPFDDVAVRDLDYRLLEGAEPTGTVVRKLFRQLSLFRSH